MKTDILIIVADLDLGGTENYLLQTLPFVKEAFQVKIFCITHKGFLASSLEDHGIAVFSLWRSKIQLFPNHYKLSIFIKLCALIISALYFLYILVSTRPKIIHCYLPTAVLFGLFLSLPFSRLKKIVSRRSQNHYQSKYPKLALLERWLMKRCDSIHANSKPVQDELVTEGFQIEKILLVRNFVRFPNILPRRYTVEKKIKFLCVANLHSYKGHRFLIQVLSTCPLSDYQWTCNLLGSDINGNLQSLRDYAYEVGLSKKINFVGSVTNTSDYYSSHDIFLFFSEQEGFPNAVAEAMSFGCAIVACNVGGITDMIKHNRTGILIKPGDMIAAQNAIKLLVEDVSLRQRLGKKAKEWILHNLNYSQTIDPIVADYKRLML